MVVEDEENLRVVLEYNLRLEGYVVHSSGDGAAALAMVRSKGPDLMILDVMLPGMSGYDVCREVRRTSDVPILMLTAKAEEVDKVVGLELGADDYVTKPFGMRELMARVHALLRRPRADADVADGGGVLQAGDLRVDLRAHVATKGDTTLELKPREFELLTLLMSQQGRAYTRRQILESLWGQDFYGEERTVDVHVRWLREKIEDTPSKPSRIVTVRGVGYRFDG
jgi:two-component system OmpR family response regulator